MNLTKYDSRDALANALAGRVAGKLREAIADTGRAGLAVSGGTTPKEFFAALSGEQLGWNDVTVTLVDERWVAPESQRSNERLVHETLLKGPAKAANFLPLYRAELTPQTIGEIEPELRKLLPFDVLLLGMGNDGHTASLFPGGSRLAEASSPDTKALVIDMEAEDAGEPRVTLTLPVIAGANMLVLHIEGDEKRAILDKAVATGDADQFPICHVLKARPDIGIVWAA